MKRYEIIEWAGQYNIADNRYLNLVVFDHTLTKEEAEKQLKLLGNELI